MSKKIVVNKTTDEIPVPIGKRVVIISPLSQDQQVMISQFRAQEGGKDVSNYAQMAVETLKYGIKSIEGFDDVEFRDGSPFELEFENGKVKEESLNCLARILGREETMKLAGDLLRDLYGTEEQGAGLIAAKSTAKKKA